MSFANAPANIFSVPVLTLGLESLLGTGQLQEFRIVSVESAEEAIRILTAETAAVLVLGPGFKTRSASEVLAMLASQCLDKQVTSIVLCAGDLRPFERHLDEGQVFYMAQGEISAMHLRSLIRCAAKRLCRETEEEPQRRPSNPSNPDRVLDMCARLAMQADLRSAGRLLEETARDLLSAGHVQCLLYDCREETLTPTDAPEGKEWTYSAAAGLAAYAVRTGECVHLDRAGLDARYDPDTDSPVGWPEEWKDARFLAAPIPGYRSTPAGVITAFRNGDAAPFSAADAQCLEFLGEGAAPAFQQILLQQRLQKLLAEQASGSDGNGGIFLQEALDYHIRSWDKEGEVLQDLPAWLRGAFWMAMGVFIAGIVALAFSWPRLGSIFSKGK